MLVVANQSAAEGVQEVRQVEVQTEEPQLQALARPRAAHDVIRAHQLGRRPSGHALAPRLRREPHRRLGRAGRGRETTQPLPQR